MHIAYMDDAGDLGALANPPLHNDQPVFALTLLVVNQVRLAALVPEFLQNKRNYFPGLIPPASHFLAAVLSEIKGADIRRDIATGTRNKARHATRFLSEIVDLCLRSDAKLISKVYVKGIGSRTVALPFTQRLARRSSRALTTTSQRLTTLDSASQIPAPRVSTFP
jgi:hypothetical protein